MQPPLARRRRDDEPAGGRPLLPLHFKGCQVQEPATAAPFFPITLSRSIVTFYVNPYVFYSVVDVPTQNSHMKDLGQRFGL